jgi:hypothetical protein
VLCVRMFDSPALPSTSSSVDKPSTKWDFRFYFMPVTPLSCLTEGNVVSLDLWFAYHICLRSIAHLLGCLLLFLSVIFSPTCLWS